MLLPFAFVLGIALRPAYFPVIFAYESTRCTWKAQLPLLLVNVATGGLYLNTDISFNMSKYITDCNNGLAETRSPKRTWKRRSMICFIPCFLVYRSEVVVANIPLPVACEGEVEYWKCSPTEEQHNPAAFPVG